MAVSRSVGSSGSVDRPSRAADAVIAPAGEEVWSVFDFARRYRLPKTEENRLLMLFGTMATPRDLLSNARRTSLIR